MDLKKLLRTLQVEFPFLLEFKFEAMRTVRKALKIPFEHDFSALPLLGSPPNPLFLDVGANRGQSTDAILMYVPDARIHLFEPNEYLSNRFPSMFEQNPNLTFHHFGLGDISSRATLNLPFYKNWMFDGLASFDENEARRWLQDRLYFYKTKNFRLRELKCRVCRLDDMELAPFFIKIDIQGFELKALRGGSNTIAKHKPIILIESPDEKIIEFLANLGYAHYAFINQTFIRNRKGKLNTYFLTPEHFERKGG